MNTIRFLARNVADAVAQVRSRLGPEAVVLSVNRVPATGLGRLWGLTMLEVLAGPPEPAKRGRRKKRPALDAVAAEDDPGQPTAIAPDPSPPEEPAPPSPVVYVAPAAKGRSVLRAATAHSTRTRNRRRKVRPKLTLRKRAVSANSARKQTRRHPCHHGPKRPKPKLVQAAAEPAAQVLPTEVPSGSRNENGSPVPQSVALPAASVSNGTVAAVVAGHPPAGPGVPAGPARTAGTPAPEVMVPDGLGGAWRSAGFLAQLGLQPLAIEQVLERARSMHGREPPGAFADEVALVRGALVSFWRPPKPSPYRDAALHAFVGPPGSGKTTVVCKWLAKSVLVEGRRARAWRLDSRGANFAGLLDLHCEILSVPLAREWHRGQSLEGWDDGFVDYPGVNPEDTGALEQLRAQMHRLPPAQVHLVLNAAYEWPVLQAQIRAFEGLPIGDLIFTHLDEEKRLGKLWNGVLGTKFTLRLLSNGQNIPGELSLATPEALIPR